VDLFNGNPVKTQTQVEAHGDRAGVAIVFDCAQPNMDKVEIAGDKRDSGIFGGNASSSSSRPSAPPDRTTISRSTPTAFKPTKRRSIWRGMRTGARSTTKRADGWTADITIPWSELPIGAKAGATFGMNSAGT